MKAELERMVLDMIKELLPKTTMKDNKKLNALIAKLDKEL